MPIKNKRDAKKETASEVLAIKKIGKNLNLKKKYWNNRFLGLYLDLLEGKNEVGRHGVIAEYIYHFIKKGSILDIGCGTGILSTLIDKNRYRYLGLDISKVAVKYAQEKRKSRRVKFICMPIENFKSREKYDAIVINEVLYYLDSQLIIQNIQSWLRGPKILIVSVFEFPEGRELLNYLKRNFCIMSETVVINPIEKFKWNILIIKC